MGTALQDSDGVEAGQPPAPNAGAGDLGAAGSPPSDRRPKVGGAGCQWPSLGDQGLVSLEVWERGSAAAGASPTFPPWVCEGCSLRLCQDSDTPRSHVCVVAMRSLWILSPVKGSRGPVGAGRPGSCLLEVSLGLALDTLTDPGGGESAQYPFPSQTRNPLFLFRPPYVPRGSTASPVHSQGS